MYMWMYTCTENIVHCAVNYLIQNYLFWDIEEQWRIRGDGWETSFEPYIEKKTHATNHLKPAVRKLSLNKTT